MSPYLEEAARLAASVPTNLCPATDAFRVLDAHPEWRLTLEDTWTDHSGKVYREVPADVISRWPSHLARNFRTFLRISRDPGPVFQLIDLLHRLDADLRIVRMTLTGCRRHGSLQQAIEYFEKLVQELDAVTGKPDRQVEMQLTYGPSFRPDVRCAENGDGVWVTGEQPDIEEQEPFAPTHRADLLHDPNGNNRPEPNWFVGQPRAWRRLYYRMKRARLSDLSHLKEVLLGLSDGSWSRDQMTVLWDTYRSQRDYLRQKGEDLARRSLRKTARKLVHRVQRIQSPAELGRIGRSLYDAMGGSIALPGAVSQPEWAVIFTHYRQRKAELSETC